MRTPEEMLADLEEFYELARDSTDDGTPEHQFAVVMLETLELLVPVESFYEDAPVKLLDETVDNLKRMMSRESWPFAGLIIYGMTAQVASHCGMVAEDDEEVLKILGHRARSLAMQMSTGFLPDDDDEEPPLMNPW